VFNQDKEIAVLNKVFAGAVVVLIVAAAACAQDKGSSDNAAPQAQAAVTMTPVDRAKATKQGELKNPYKDDNADIVAQGQKLFMHAGCNGCHGGNGGGGMCPPLTNDTWVYGGDDDTLFRLVTLGSDELQKQGYTRKGHENVVGPMPPHGTIVKTDDDLWKIITFIRSNYHGSPDHKFGDKPAAP
jgi:mono/diheme cytochrome c family protein